MSFFIKLWLLLFKFLKKTCFSEVVATGQDTIYKSSQLSVAVTSGVTQTIMDFATWSLAASWRYVGMLEQYYRSSNIISDWISHRHILYNIKEWVHGTKRGLPRVSSRHLVAVEPGTDDGKMTEHGQRTRIVSLYYRIRC